MVRRSVPWFLLACAAALACATSQPPAPEQRERIERAQQDLPDDPTIQAHVEAVKAARAREAQPQIVEEVEIRVGDDFKDDDHQMRVTARVPINRPWETSAEQEVLRAETDMALSRLEEVSLERRAERCFPEVTSLAARGRREIQADYAEWQKLLLAWNADWRGSGMINELAAARFELESRIKLSAWEPTSLDPGGAVSFSLPEASAGPSPLVTDPDLIRATVRNHHPGVALRRATADRYRALAQRARARNRPWLKFVDVRYEYDTNNHENGVGGQLAFEVPLGGQVANVGRYEALVRESDGSAKGLVEDQVARSVQALTEVNTFEARTEDWRTLTRLADEAEIVADRWWRKRLAKPSEVADLIDEAFAARSAILDARERTGTAYCTLLAMTGVPVESWPRTTDAPSR